MMHALELAGLMVLIACGAAGVSVLGIILYAFIRWMDEGSH